MGLLKRLEVARALATQPSLLLFDEIMAGLTPPEVREMTAAIAALPGRGITVIWVEHVMMAIMKVAQRLLVLHRGELIAQGSQPRSSKDPAVIDGLSRRGNETCFALRISKRSTDRTQVLHAINLTVEEREIVGLVGANAAGKSTLMFTLAGLQAPAPARSGSMASAIDHLPAYERVRRALVLMPERRRLFPVHDRAREPGDWAPISRSPRRSRAETLEQVLELLPVLAERRHQVAGSLSGGEQQMLRDRARPDGLPAHPPARRADRGPRADLRGTPVRADGAIARLWPHDPDRRAERRSTCCAIADRAYVLENGRIVLEDTGRALLQDPRLKTAYLGL